MNRGKDSVFHELFVVREGRQIDGNEGAILYLLILPLLPKTVEEIASKETLAVSSTL